ncbi:MAG: protein kinase [bacterium]
MIGKTISQYKILEKLGEGGMGVVYKARDTRLDRFVALKFLPQHLNQAEEEKKRFIHEAKAASALDHNNICTIYEIDETEEGQLFIAMACYEGQSLKEKIERGPMPIDEALNITIQIAEGLAKAHSKKIIHRDIKPANILITEDDQVKIVDFGLAKLAGRTMLTKEGTTLGTVAYMSPEQAQSAEVDHRTDIWALGAVLYQMITGQPPFKGDYEQAVIYSIMNEEAEPVTGLRTGVPMELERIVNNKAMAKSPDERYQRVDELLVDLKSLRKEVVSGKPRERPTQIKAAPRKKSYLYRGLAALLIVLILGSLYLWKNSESKKNDLDESASSTSLQRLAVLPFANIRSDPQTDFLGFALADQIIGSLAYVNEILVRPSSAVRPYQNQIVDALTAGDELKVDFILTGHYLKEADIVRLNIELVNVHSNEMLWREPVNVKYESTFELQDMVAKKVVDGLKIRFSQDERGRMQTNISKNPLAYEYYLRAISYPSTNEGDKLAIEMLTKSIQLDSTYAPTYTEIGHRMQRFANYAFAGSEALRKAEEAHLKALSLNGEMLSALYNLSLLYTETGRNEKAVELVRKMLKINPNYAQAHFSLSYIYRYAGMLKESEQEVEKAFALDPKNPRFRSAGLTYRYLGKYQQAIEAFELDKGSPFEFESKAEVLLLMGQREQAMEYIDRVIEMEPEGYFAYNSRVLKSFINGNIKEGLRIAREWEKTNPNDAEQLYYLAISYGQLGDKVGCIRVLQKAVELGFFNYPYMLTDSYLGTARDEPEFQQVLALAKAKHEAFKKKFFSN